MAVKTKEEIMAQLGTYVGDDAGDEVLGLIQDISDTLDSANPARIKELEEEKDNLDKSWRKKYRDTFLNGKPDDIDEDEDDEPKRPKTFEDLFK